MERREFITEIVFDDDGYDKGHYVKEEITRCKDCRHVDLKDFIHGTCKYRTGELTPTSYCERGEKKWTGQPEE